MQLYLITSLLNQESITQLAQTVLAQETQGSSCSRDLPEESSTGSPYSLLCREMSSMLQDFFQAVKTGIQGLAREVRGNRQWNSPGGGSTARSIDGHKEGLSSG